MDPWNNAQRYEQYVGRWSRVVARKFITWITGSTASSSDQQPGAGGWAAPAMGKRWLDVGCGTGALSQAVQAGAEPDELLAIDRTPVFMRQARQTSQGSSWGPGRHLGWICADAQHLPLNSAMVDAVVSGLMLNFVPDPAQAAREMRRVTRPGGVVALYVWDYAKGMQLMRHFWDAAGELDPAAVKLDEGRSFTLCNPDRLREIFLLAGLQQVETTAIDIDTVFQDFDDYWSPFLGGQGPAPSYTLSLSEERRAVLRERIRAGLPISPDGAIRLTARAWAVRGVAK